MIKRQHHRGEVHGGGKERKAKVLYQGQGNEAVKDFARGYE